MHCCCWELLLLLPATAACLCCLQLPPLPLPSPALLPLRWAFKPASWCVAPDDRPGAPPRLTWVGQHHRTVYTTSPPVLPRPPPLAAGSFFEGWGHSIASGDVEAALGSPECDCVLEGETKMGGQVRPVDLCLVAVWLLASQSCECAGRRDEDGWPGMLLRLCWVGSIAPIAGGCFLSKTKYAFEGLMPIVCNGLWAAGALLP